MDFCHLVRSGGRDDRATLYSITGNIVFPEIPFASKGERSIICSIDVVGLLLATLLLPFVKTAGEDQASFGFDCVSKEWLVCNGFCTGIKGSGYDIDIFDPVRNESPSESFKFSYVALFYDDGYLQCRHNVVAQCKRESTVYTEVSFKESADR